MAGRLNEKLEMCIQVSDREASQHQAVLSFPFPVRRVVADARTSAPAGRHRKHWPRQFNICRKSFPLTTAASDGRNVSKGHKWSFRKTAARLLQSFY